MFRTSVDLWVLKKNKTLDLTLNTKLTAKFSCHATTNLCCSFFKILIRWFNANVGLFHWAFPLLIINITNKNERNVRYRRQFRVTVTRFYPSITFKIQFNLKFIWILLMKTTKKWRYKVKKKKKQTFPLMKSQRALWDIFLEPKTIISIEISRFNRARDFLHPFECTTRLFHVFVKIIYKIIHLAYAQPFFLSTN